MNINDKDFDFNNKEFKQYVNQICKEILQNMANVPNAVKR